MRDADCFAPSRVERACKTYANSFDRKGEKEGEESGRVMAGNGLKFAVNETVPPHPVVPSAGTYNSFW